MHSRSIVFVVSDGLMKLNHQLVPHFHSELLYMLDFV